MSEIWGKMWGIVVWKPECAAAAWSSGIVSGCLEPPLLHMCPTTIQDATQSIEHAHQVQMIFQILGLSRFSEGRIN